MDPFTAVALVGNILQFVAYTKDIYTQFNEIRTSARGLTRKNEQLAQSASRIHEMVDAVAGNVKSLPENLTWTEKQIQEAGENTKRLAEEVLADIESQTVQDRSSPLATAKSIFNGTWKASAIEKKLKELDALQQLLSRLLITHISQKQDGISMAMTSMMEENRRLEINRSDNFKQLQTDIEAIKDHSIKSASVSKFASTLVAWTEQVRVLQREQAIVDSLSFDGMLHRRDDIRTAHENTFQWVHDPSLHFQQWLTSEKGVYWITGEAGSGKSTLIKYLNSHARTHELLEAWAAPKTLVRATFYFWFSGKPLQKSQEGLLRSLLYEIFRQCPEVVSAACSHRWLSEKQRPWERQELLDTLKKISLQSRSARFCFFIDGLDEYQGGPGADTDGGVATHIRDIVQVMDELSKLPEIKLCLSSRPWHAFEEAFGRVEERKLYVHKENREDIRTYIRDKFEQSVLFVESTTDRAALAEVLEELVDNSGGVFLWVFLAVQSLLRGLRNQDRPAELKSRLRETPKTLNKMFERMLQSVEPMYREQAAQMLLVALHAGKPLYVATYSFIGDPDFNALDANTEPWSPEKCESISNTSEVRIKVRCPDLIGIRRPRDVPLAAEDMVGHQVEFLHRTVRDFLALDETQRQLKSSLTRSFDPGVYLCHSLLMHIMGTSTRQVNTQGQRRFWQLLDDVCRYAEELEQRLGEPQTTLLDKLEEVVAQKHDSLHFPDGDDSFLGLMVQRDMPLYVETKLPRYSAHYVMPLLYRALRPHQSFGQPMGVAPSPQMVALLLEHGHRPEASMPRSDLTVWNTYMADLHKSFIARAEEEAHLACIVALLQHGADPYLRCVVGWSDPVPTPGRAKGVRYPKEVELLETIGKLFQPRQREYLEAIIQQRRRKFPWDWGMGRVGGSVAMVWVRIWSTHFKVVL